MATKSEPPFPASNVNDCETKSEFDNVYDCMHSPPDGIARAINVTIDGEHPPISHSRGCCDELYSSFEFGVGFVLRTETATIPCPAVTSSAMLATC